MNGWPLIQKTLRDSRTATIAIGATNLAMALLVVLIYPEFADTLGEAELPDFYEALSGGLAFNTPEGFLAGEFFSWIPLLLITLAIIAGTGAIAGEESAGTMEQLLAQPVRRRTILLQKAAGLTIAVVIAALVSLPGLIVAKYIVDLDVSVGRLTLATLNMLPISLVYLGISLWGSAALPTRGTAAVVAIGAVVIPFLLETVLATAGTLDWLRKIMPFYWVDAGRVLIGEGRIVPPIVFLALFAALVALAVQAFERREIAASPGLMATIKGWFGVRVEREPRGPARPIPGEAAE